MRGDIDMRRVAAFLVALGAVTLLPISIHAQTRENIPIQGVLTDDAGEPIHGSVVSSHPFGE